MTRAMSSLSDASLQAVRVRRRSPNKRGEEPALAGISASPGKGTELGVSKNTPGSASSSEIDSFAALHEELEN